MMGTRWSRQSDLKFKDVNALIANKAPTSTVREYLNTHPNITGENKHRIDNPIWVAIHYGRFDLLDDLVTIGLGGPVPILLAGAFPKICGKPNISYVKLLVEEYGVDVNGQDSDSINSTPLIQAIVNGRGNIVQYLIEKGASVNVQNKWDEIPLHMCAQSVSGYPYSQMCECLISHGAQVDGLDHNNNTPLHIAARFGNTDVLYTLLRHGANTNLRNSRNQTPFKLVFLTHWHCITSLPVEDIFNLCCAARLLLYAGYKPTKEDLGLLDLEDINVKIPENVQQQIEDIKQFMSSPRYLKDLCILKLRQELRTGNGLHTADYLPLPEYLKMCVKLEHIYDVQRTRDFPVP